VPGRYNCLQFTGILLYNIRLWIALRGTP
jgi:hypothetical protein